MLTRLLHNAAISVAGQLVTWTSTLVLTLAYGRFLGDDKFGELIFATTFIGLLSVPAGGTAGYDMQVTRQIAHAPDQGKRYLANVVVIKISVWALVYVLALLLSVVFAMSTETRALIGICGLTFLTSTLAVSLSSVQYAYERALYPVIGSIVEKMLAAGLGVTVLALGGGVRAMALILLVGSLANLLWQAFCFLRLVHGPVSIERDIIRNIVRASIPFLLYGLIGTVYYRMDVILLSALTNDQVVGWYGAGYRLFDTLCFLPWLMLTLLYPVFSKLALDSEDQLKLAAEKLMNFTLFTGIPIGTLLIVAADPIIRTLYHRPEFAHGIPSLQALAPGLVALYVNMALGIVFLNTKQDKRLPLQSIVALVFNVAANLILIPLYLHVGAAIATTLTEFLLTGIGLYLVPRRLRPLRSLVTAGRALAASVVMGVVVSYLAPLGIIVVPLAAVIYLVVAIWIGVIELSDLEAVRGAVQVRGALARGYALLGQLAGKVGARVVRPATSDV